MTITISSAFDAGNIRVVKRTATSVDLEIVKDHCPTSTNGSTSAWPAAPGAR